MRCIKDNSIVLRFYFHSATVNSDTTTPIMLTCLYALEKALLSLLHLN